MSQHFPFRLKMPAQILHLQSYFPSWTDAMCLVKWAFLAKPLSQILELKRTSCFNKQVHLFSGFLFSKFSTWRFQLWVGKRLSWPLSAARIGFSMLTLFHTICCFHWQISKWLNSAAITKCVIITRILILNSFDCKFKNTQLTPFQQQHQMEFSLFCFQGSCFPNFPL